MAGYDTLIVVQERWSLTDLLDAHEALAIKAEAEEFVARSVKNADD